MIYDLPTSVEVGGTEYSIRSDYRAVLDICTALSDPELTAQDKGIVALGIFYGEDIFQRLPVDHYEEALRRCGYDTKIRGEVLDLGGFAKISDEISKIQSPDL